MGETFCFPIRRLVSAKEVKVPPPKIAPHFRVRRVASNPSEGDRSGNKKMFSVSSIPSKSLVCKASAITMTMTAWGVCGGRKRRL